MISHKIVAEKRSKKMANYTGKTEKYGNPLYLLVILSVLYAISFYNYLLFHALSEIASVAISFGIFAVVWTSRKYITNGYFLVVGIACFFVGAVDTLHMLSYKNMNVFGIDNPEISIQLWLVARFLGAFSFLVAAFFADKTVKTRLISIFYAVMTAVFLLAVFRWNVFPETFNEETGLTQFKKASEYAISLMLVLALVFLWKKGRYFDGKVVGVFSLALTLMIGSELVFTFYQTFTDNINLWGHQLKTASIYFVYIAIVEMGLLGPYRRMFEDLKKKEKSLRESEEKYRLLAELSPDAIVLHDKGEIIYANSSAGRILGADKTEDLFGKKMTDFVHKDYKDKIKGRMRALYDNKIIKVPFREMQFVRLDGSVVDVEVSGTLVEYGNRKLIQSIIRDITRRRETQKKIEYLSSHDFLTGLYNRFHFERMIANFSENKIAPVSVVVVDLDGLKKVNDTLGHSGGDRLIRNAAAVLSKTFRKEDIVARIGGDEFAILLPGTEEDEVLILLQRLMKNIDEENRIAGGSKLEFSYGFETARASEEISKRFRMADESMYKQKQEKKKRLLG